MQFPLLFTPVAGNYSAQHFYKEIMVCLFVVLFVVLFLKKKKKMKTGRDKPILKNNVNRPFHVLQCYHCNMYAVFSKAQITHTLSAWSYSVHSHLPCR